MGASLVVVGSPGPDIHRALALLWLALFWLALGSVSECCTSICFTALTYTAKHCKCGTLQRQILGYTIRFIPLTALYLSAFVTQKKSFWFIIFCFAIWLHISIALYQSLVHCCSFECFVSGRSELSVTVLMESLRSTPDQRQWWGWWWWRWWLWQWRW